MNRKDRQAYRFGNVILTRKRLVKTGVVAVVLTVLLLTSNACPDGAPAHQAMHGGGALPAQTPVRTDAIEVTIEISGYNFSPRDLTVEAGATITWLNRDGVPHDATEAEASWTTSTLNQGESGAIVFDSPGRYKYFCTIHPAMRASINVQTSEEGPNVALTVGHSAQALAQSLNLGSIHGPGD